jgi:ABC-type lipoprotein release transport system permease subunit
MAHFVSGNYFETLGVRPILISLRVREIGVRIALGAEPRDVRGMLLREGATLMAIGIVFGLAAAFALSRALESMLVGVGALDAATFVVLRASLRPLRWPHAGCLPAKRRVSLQRSLCAWSKSQADSHLGK